MKYPARFIPDKEAGGFVVEFRDLPGVRTQGDTMEEAMDMAGDVLSFGLKHYFDNKLQIPLPSVPKRGDKLIELPPSIAAKVYLLNTMLESKIKHGELAKQMNVPKSEINRMINFEHATKIDRVAEALKVLGKHLELSIS